MTVEADSPEEAVRIARQRGMIAEKVEPLDRESEEDAAPPTDDDDEVVELELADPPPPRRRSAPTRKSRRGVSRTAARCCYAILIFLGIVLAVKVSEEYGPTALLILLTNELVVFCIVWQTVLLYRINRSLNEVKSRIA